MLIGQKPNVKHAEVADHRQLPHASDQQRPDVWQQRLALLEAQPGLGLTLDSNYNQNM